jgi:hypothetical protein
MQFSDTFVEWLNHYVIEARVEERMQSLQHRGGGSIMMFRTEEEEMDDSDEIEDQVHCL